MFRKHILNPMLQSTHRWITILLISASCLFFWGGPDFDSNRIVTEFWNLGHLLFFALLAWLLDHYWLLKDHSRPFRIAATLIILATLGLATELIQAGMADRYFSYTDLFKDFSGGIIVLCWKMSREVESCFNYFKMIAVVFLFLNIFPLINITLDEYRLHKDFPLLAGFEYSSEFGRWNGVAKISMDSQIYSEGSHSAKIELGTEQYSGVFLDQFPRDWSKRNSLVFSVYNPGATLQLNFRVHDNLHTGELQEFTNRFNGRSVLKHGWNDISIPMADILHGPEERTMNLDKIKCFGIFVVKQDTKRTIYLDNVRLL